MANEQNLKPFKKGDPRINRKGKPKNIPGLRDLVLSILHEVATDKNGQPLVIDGHTATVIEAKVRQLIQSRNTQDTRIVFDYAFGKLVDKVELTGTNGGPVATEIIIKYADDNHSPAASGAAPDTRQREAV